MKKLKKMLALVLMFLLIMQAWITAYASSAVIDLTRKGSITVYVLQDRDGSVVTSKGTGEIQTIPDGATALEGVKFELYKVDDDYSQTTIPSGSSALKTATTDSQGEVQFSDLELGRYLVVPIDFPSNVSVEIANFLVDIPMPNAAQTAWNYDVLVYPKVQTVYGSVVLTVENGDGEPIPNATIQLMKKNEDGTYSVYTNSEYISSDSYTTNSNGQICIDNLPAGEYQFVETSVPDGYGLNSTPVQFTVTETSSTTGSDEDGWVASEEDLNLTLTNYITPDSDDFEFNKKLGDGISGGANIDGVQTWKITSDIPADIENYTRFLITDNISEKLVLNESSIIVKADGTTLTKNTNYKVYYSDNLLKIAFVDSGIDPAGLDGKASLEITYTTTLNRDQIVMGESIENSADLFWDTKYDEDGDDSSEDPTTPEGDDEDKVIEVDTPASVHTGGLKIKKVDESGNALAGATFKIATTEANAKNGVFVKIDGVDISATSGSDGLLYFEGLAYGTSGQSNDVASSQYWLVETEAPDGYNLLSSPVEVTVDKDSYTTSNPTTIENKKGLVLPATGGIGTIIFIVIGSCVMFTGIIILVKKDKDEEEEIQET